MLGFPLAMDSTELPTADVKSALSGPKDLAEESSDDTQMEATVTAFEGTTKKRKVGVLDQSEGNGDGDKAEEHDEEFDEADKEEAEEMDKETDEDCDNEEERGGIRFRWSKWEVEPFVSFHLSSDETFNYISDADERDIHRRYLGQICGSQGFLVERENIPEYLYGGVLPCGSESLEEKFRGGTLRDMVKEVASMAFERYNRKQGMNVRFESAVRMNAGWHHGGALYFLTVMARESPDADPIEYQVKCMHKVSGKFYPIFCRPAPNP